MKNTKRHCAGLALLALLLVRDPASAQDLNVSPATLDPAQSLEQYIQFPKGDEDIFVTIPCTANISERGQMRGNQCYFANDRAKPYSFEIFKASTKARMIPATENGKPVSVGLQYSVSFLRKDGVASTKVALNYGQNTAIHGPDYIDAQVIAFAWDSKGQVCLESDVLWPKVVITAQGQVLDPQLVAPKASPTCVSYLKDMLTRARFIPAFKDGRPVDSTLSVPLRGFVRDQEHSVRVSSDGGVP